MKISTFLYLPAIAILAGAVIGCSDKLPEGNEPETPKSEDCSLTSFTIKGSENGLEKDVHFTLNTQTNTFSAMYLKWIDRDNPEMITPTFQTDGVSVLVDGKEIESGVSSISFADDFTITVMAENGDSQEYTISLNCPQINSELPVLHMRPRSQITSKDSYVDTDITLYDKSKGSAYDLSGGTDKEGWYEGTIEMRGRGNSTWGLPKKPFRMKWGEKFSPIGLNHAEEKSWVLLAQDMDKSLLRTHLAFEYSRELFKKSESYHDPKAVLFTPCSKYVNVYFTGRYYYSDTGITKDLDGEYIGIYQMSDQVQRKTGRIEVDKLEAADGNDPSKITGGYIIETDIHEGNHYSSRGIKMTYKYPEDDDFDQSQYDYISNYINEAEAVLYSSNYTDPVNGWRKYFDEKTLADFIIIKEFVGDMDGYTSTYFYKRRGHDKFFFGPIWDCDKGWDNEKRIPHWEYQPLESLMIHAGFWMPSNVSNDWFWRFWSDAEFRKFVNNRWKQKKAQLQQITNDVLEDVPASMPKAIKANFSVWEFHYQHSTEAKMPAETYEKEIERIKRLSGDRANLMDREFAK